MRLVVLVGISAAAAMIPPAASACPGRFAEEYALRATAPAPVSADEIVLEVEPATERSPEGDAATYLFNVKRVVSGAYDGQTVLIKISPSSCSRLLFESTAIDVFVAGALGSDAFGRRVLRARMQSYSERNGSQ